MIAVAAMLPCGGFAQENMNVKFDNINTSNGLSNNQIHSIYQDQQGYIWIGTLSGLNRYDGYEVKSFFHQQDDPSSLKNNTIIWIAEGPEEKLWVKHNEGISLYNPFTEQFESPANYLERLKTDAAFITEILKDREGDYWFAIENRGIVKLEGDQMIEMNQSSNGEVKLASNNITDLLSGNDGNVWIVHSFGQIEVIDPIKNKVVRRYGFPDQFTHHDRYWNLFVDMDGDIWLFSTDDPFGLYYLNTKNGDSKVLDASVLRSDIVRGVVQHENGYLWIGADHGGITLLNKHNWEIKSVGNDPDLPKSLVSNNVNSIFRDRSGGIWVGTAKSGVSYHHIGADNFKHYKINRKDPAYNDFSSFAEDDKHNLWIGSNGKGLIKFDLQKRTFTSLLDQGNYKGKMPDVVVSMIKSSSGKILVGSFLEGLFEFDGHQFNQLDIFPTHLVGVSIWDLFEDRDGKIWIGTLKNGVFQWNPTTNQVIQYSQADIMNSNYFTCITQDNSGRIWLGTGTGLNIFDPQTQQVKSYLASDNQPNSLSNNSIISMLQDRKGRMWVATLEGLNLYDGEDGFRVFKTKDGISSNIVMALQEDDEGNIWMSTSKGITKMIDTEDGFGFQTFDISDGLQADNFTEDAGFKTSDGELIFSGQNGFNIFVPEEIEISAKSPNLLLTRFSVANQPIIPGQQVNDRVLLKKPISKTRELELRYDENSFAIEFVALSFFQSGKIRYQYMLDGFDKDWINASPGMRKVNYTNLDYGTYSFRLRASANPNNWTGDDIKLTIHINPPFWQTPLAYLAYMIFLGLFFYLTRTYIVRRERQKAYVESEKREAQRQHELDLMKIKFFTNISHEFRTPLSLVLTPIERMIKDPENIRVTDLTIAQRNTKRLMTLVNQLLDFRKLEANQHKLSQSSGNIIVFLQDIVDSFSDLSLEKEVAITFHSEIKSFFTFFDKDKMEKIMFNLISNAFKFTLAGGQVKVDFEILDKSEDGHQVMIMVSDTGIGIPKDKQELIFKRFFQNETTGEIVNNGTGIGLSITREFVELHGGRISVDSAPDNGSTFIVELPLKEINTDEDIAAELVKELTLSSNGHSEDGEPIDSDKPTVLLVEDSFDFRFYLKDNLKQYYNIAVASNGKEAWKMVKNSPPDIVISDVMMPIMDGHELCEKIKADPRTSHVPVILLTAQSSDQHRIEGLEAGAIEYISKPFNFEILLSSINSALKFQRRVKESEHKIKAEPSEINIVSMDEQLISKAVELVEANISNAEFSVEDLSHELGYSRGHFYQKILKITGQSPIDFIRSIRMKRAADLLKRSQLNVSEVAYKVGYNNPKLFSRYFKSVYHMYPSEYRTQNEEIDN